MWNNWDWRFLGGSVVLGAILGWLAGWWRSRATRRTRRAIQDAIRAAEADVARAGPILQREIDRLEREIAVEKRRLKGRSE
jgi:hypothetical protein